MSNPTEIIDAEVVKSDIVRYMGGIIGEAQQLALAVKDDASANLATELGVAIKAKIVWLKSKREEVYVPLFRATERVRNEFDEPLKLGAQLEKTLAAAVTQYKLAKRREEDRLRLAAEAEARRIREEADRKEREAEAERQRILKEQETRERARKEAEAAEERRVLAEAKAKEDAERARLQREQDERAKRIQEEENARLAKAQEAQDVGLPERVETILETPTPIAPVVAPIKTTAETEAAARKEADAKAEAELKRAEAAAEEARLRGEEQEKMRKLREDADKAKADADLAESMAAAQASVTLADDRMRTNVVAKYQVASKADFLKLAKAVAEGRVPIEFLNYDPEAPEKFRSSAIGAHATDIKKKPDFAAKQAELAAVGITVWLEDSGTFKAQKALA